MIVTNNITWKQNKQSIINVRFICFKYHHSHSVVVSWRISTLKDKRKAYQRAEWKSQAKSWCVAIPLHILNYSTAVLNTTYSKLDLYSSQLQARQALICYANHSEIPTRFHNYYPIVLTESLPRYTYSKSALWEFHFERTFIGSTIRYSIPLLFTYQWVLLAKLYLNMFSFPSFKWFEKQGIFTIQIKNIVFSHFLTLKWWWLKQYKVSSHIKMNRYL